MKYFTALITIPKLEGYSLTFQKLSIKCGTRESFIKLNARDLRKFVKPFNSLLKK